MEDKNIDLIIRLEHPDDYEDVLRLNYEAFQTLDYPGRVREDEHYLIYLLRGSKSVIPELTFVAEQGGKIVAHILYTNSVIEHPDGQVTPTITFGPVCVHPKLHRQGIGAAIIKHSMDKARELGHGAVLITGVTDYYPKLGFKRAREYNLTLEDGTSEDSFMAYELIPGYIKSEGKLKFLAPEYALSEVQDERFETFHKKFLEEYYT
jgi:predicted N-acetyltransferase YhbS